MTDNRTTHLAAAEAATIRALSIAPEHARAHLHLGTIQISTNRGTQGIAEIEQALALDRNLANAHGWIGAAKYFIGRGAETEPHIREALRLSPRDTFVSRWMAFVGFAKAQLNADEEAVIWFRRSIEAIESAHGAHRVRRYSCTAR